MKKIFVLKFSYCLALARSPGSKRNPFFSCDTVSQKPFEKLETNIMNYQKLNLCSRDYNWNLRCKCFKNSITKCFKFTSRNMNITRSINLQRKKSIKKFLSKNKDKKQI